MVVDMKAVKIIIAILLALSAIASGVMVIVRLLSYNGSSFELGQLGGTVFITCMLAVGSVMLFKSARTKTKEESE